MEVFYSQDKQLSSQADYIKLLEEQLKYYQTYFTEMATKSVPKIEIRYEDLDLKQMKEIYKLRKKEVKREKRLLKRAGKER